MSGSPILMADLNVAMGVGCGRTEREDYLHVIQNTQLISVDILVRCGGKFLLGKRNNNPAKGYWFVPGSRVYKGESLQTAVSRIMLSELGVLDYSGLRLFGVYDHRYSTNFDNEDFGTEYIVFAHMLDITEEVADKIKPDDQHNKLEWLYPHEILDRTDVHPNNKKYFQKQPDNLILKST